MFKQLMIVGFHRSGTSMLTQELHHAGLFVGERLLGAHISNADGHFEDEDIFRFHEKVLNAQNETWQYASKASPSMDEIFQFEMQTMIDRRNATHQEWGFKDPRTSLFLSQWQEKLDNSFTVVIYRHYEECVNSLLHRASMQISDNMNSDLSFWEDPMLAYKMWLSYNQHILSHIEKNPDTTLVVSHESIINGFPIVQTLNEKFGFTLDALVESAVKKGLLSPKDFPSNPLDKELKKELDETWNKLQSLSISPSNHVNISANKKALYSMNDLEDRLNKLEIKTENRNVIEEMIEKIEDTQVEIKQKIALIQKNRALFTQLHANKRLLQSVLKILIKEYANIELYFIISELYRVEKEYELAELYLLKAFTVADKIYPYFYNTLANFYLNTNQLLLAESAIKKAIQGNPNNYHFYITYARLEEKKFDNVLALEYIDKAISMLDENINAEIGCKLQKINILYQSMKEEEKSKSLLSELVEKYPDDERVKKRAKAILEEKEVVFNKEKEEEETLVRLREDENYFLKIVSFLESIEEEWAKNDLLSRMVEHLGRFDMSKYSIKNENIQVAKVNFQIIGVQKGGTTALDS